MAIARENAKLAGVEKLIHFQRRDVAQLSHPKKYGFIITNPPYGERSAGKGRNARPLPDNRGKIPGAGFLEHVSDNSL